MNLQELEKNLLQDLNNQILTGKIVLHKFRLINENNRKSSAYLDSRYAPFYYHLGKYLKPESFFEIGFNLGLLSGSFLSSCKTVKYFFGYNEPEEGLSLQLGKSNIRLCFKGQSDFYLGKTFDEEFIEKVNQRKWDLILIDKFFGYDKSLQMFELAWENLKSDGLMFVEHINDQQTTVTAMKDFLISRNRTFVNFKTRYGTAMIQK